VSNKLLLLGGGGHCRSVLACLDRSRYEDVVILDHESNLGKAVDGVRIAGTDGDLERLYELGYREAFITLGGARAHSRRGDLYAVIERIGFDMPVIVDPTAAIADTAVLRQGVFVGKNAVVNAGAAVGACAIINTGAIVEHDCVIGAFSHIATGAVLSGNVKIGRGTHVGAGASVRQGVSIGDNTTVGMGSVVLSDLPDGCTAYGVPCRKAERP
jgi:sugar O-acyltransferase (sialic acid O-acetyltransferase NeuD family)